MRTFQFGYPVKEMIYKTIGSRNLILYIFEPEVQRDESAVILFLNGGSFHKGPQSPLQFQHQAKYFSTLGITTVCVDYRNGYDEGFTPLQAICDVKSAVRWIRKNADRLHIDRNKIVVCGASAGGYLAVSAIMFEHIDEDVDRTTPVPNACIIFAAVMDGVDIMRRRSPELLDIAEDISPLRHVKRCMPRTLWISGTADEVYHQNQEFINQMVHAGNDITFKSYKDMEHGFFNYGRHENKYFYETKIEIENFLKTLKYIE